MVGTKRKADDARDTSSLLLHVSEKEWACSICGVTAVNLKCFDLHLNGKKHRSRLASFIAQENATKIVCDPTFKEGNPKKRRIRTPDKKNTAGMNKASCQDHGGFPSSEMMEANKCVLVDVHDGAKDLLENQYSSSRKKRIWCKLCEVSFTGRKGLFIHLEGKKHKARLARLNSQTHGQQSRTAAPSVMEANEDGIKIDGENIRKDKEMSNKVAILGSSAHVIDGTGKWAENIRSLTNVVGFGEGTDSKADEIAQEGLVEPAEKERNIDGIPSSIGSTQDNASGTSEGDENPATLAVENESGGVKNSNRECIFVSKNAGTVVENGKSEAKSGEEGAGNL